MKITAIDTVRLDGVPEPRASSSCTPTTVSSGWARPSSSPTRSRRTCTRSRGCLLGGTPAAIEAHARALRGYVGQRVQRRGDAGSASAIDIALWDLCGQASGQPLHRVLGGASRDSIRTYNTCAGYRYIRDEQRSGGHELGAAARTAAEGPYEDLDAFLNRADELARDLLAQGITGMKIWPFDPYAEASRRARHLDRRPRSGARAVPEDPRRGRPGDRRHGRAPRALGRAGRVSHRRAHWTSSTRAGSRIPSGSRVRTRSPRCRRRRASPLAVGETLAGLPAFRDLLTRGGARRRSSTSAGSVGIAEARKIAALAEAYERPVAPHDCTGPVVYTAATHLSMHAAERDRPGERARLLRAAGTRELVTALPVVENGMRPAAERSGSRHGAAARRCFEREDVHIRSSRNAGRA